MKKLLLGSVLMLSSASAQAKEYNVDYVTCYDGDTCTFDFHLGFGIKSRQSIRWCDVDTPEIRPLKTRKRATEARDYVRNLLIKAKRIVVDIQFKKNCVGAYCEADTFGRPLGYVYADGINLNELLLDKGVGVLDDKTCKEYRR